MTDTPSSIRTPRKKNWLSPDFVRAMLAGHSALGLAFAALIYIVCLSGTLAVFVLEFKRWEQPNAPLVAAEPAPAALQAAMRAAFGRAKMGSKVPDLFIAWDGSRTPHLGVSFHDHESSAEGEWLANEQGQIVEKAHAPWSEFLAKLHIHLHLPQTYGLFIVGLTGVALLSSLISGVLSHPRIFRDAFSFRLGGSRRLQDADLHNRLGVWGLPFHIAVSLTGALLGLSVLVIGVLALAAYEGDSEKAFAVLIGPQAGKDHKLAPLPNLDAMIAQVRKEHPDAEFRSVHVEHAGTAGQMTHLSMQTPGHLSTANPYYFDGSGELVGDGGLERGSVGQQILGALHPIHFGWFGGTLVKIAYGLLGLALTIVTHTGVTIWLHRKREKGNPEPFWERIWAALAWSQPFALAAAALVVLAAASNFALTSYLVCFGLALVIGYFAPGESACARILRLLTGLTLCAVAVAHVANFRGEGMADPVAWIIDGLLAGCGLILMAGVLIPFAKKHLPRRMMRKPTYPSL
ncbi:PepSY domain-containing protein [Methyloceanibacter sp. wino2]|uniref:PepSY-associated TM helix domain-containing protein n=1 Tax=Methyloceanibacter sp. wino2 TaxID=2170729 RepID=UPI000D3EB97A|nr:PepSY-associated TM helix domain-containing protein [Methyloceanibacter sp. wino2]